VARDRVSGVRGSALLGGFGETRSLGDNPKGDRDSAEGDEDGKRIFPSRMTLDNQWRAISAPAEVRVRSSTVKMCR
jgi:hypothetical protein